MPRVGNPGRVILMKRNGIKIDPACGGFDVFTSQTGL
jgi:hypothetical protein